MLRAHRNSPAQGGAVGGVGCSLVRSASLHRVDLRERGGWIRLDSTDAAWAAHANESALKDDVDGAIAEDFAADRAGGDFVVGLLRGDDLRFVLLRPLRRVFLEAIDTLLAAEAIHAILKDHSLRVGFKRLVLHHDAVLEGVWASSLHDRFVHLRDMLGGLSLECGLTLRAAELHLGAVELGVLHAIEHDSDRVFAELLS